MARLKSLVTTEDWWTVWIGAVLLASVFTGIVDSVPTLSRWSSLSDSIPAEGILPLLILLVSVAILTGIAVRVLDGNALAYTKAFPAIFVLGTVAFLVGTNQVMAAYGLGYALWALVIGLVVSNLIGTPGCRACEPSCLSRRDWSFWAPKSYSERCSRWAGTESSLPGE